MMKSVLITFVAVAFSLAASAQQGPVLTSQDYQRAEQFLSYNTQSLVDYGGVRANWMSGERFWYRVLTPTGSRFVLVDAAKGQRTPAFDHDKLAAALSSVTGKSYLGDRLPFQSIRFSDDAKSIDFKIDGQNYRYDIQKNSCTLNAEPATASILPQQGRRPRGNEVLSPDGSMSAFIKEYNLWVRNVKTGDQVQLTRDGIKDYGYATDNAGWRKSDRPVLRWSPDSKMIATFRQDQRNAGNMYLVTTNVGTPSLEQWKYPLPGDKNIITIERVIVNVETPAVIRLKVLPDPHRATLSDDISSSGTFDDVDWSADASQLAFVSTSRDHKIEKFRIADASTGEVREIFTEEVSTQFESGQGTINWRYLAKTNEIIWYSERDNWGHLYLYDATTGKLKNQITKGDWVVTSLVKVDEKNRQIYFLAGGKEPGNPYFSHLYKVDFDGQKLTSLTPEEGHHQVSFSPSENYFVDTYSQPNVPPVMVLRNLDGKLITNLEQTDISRLKATGWQPPSPVTVKAADGQTDLFGLMFTPTNLVTSKKYPVINYIYPGPQGGSVGSWAFSASRGDHQALAELGFIVIVLEGSSNPLRSKSYHDMNYGNMVENTLPDQISGIRQLAQRFSYIDTSRVGIWGHSGGGYATATAMFRYPDFFKVGISESGNHDNRNYEDDWGERYIGLLTKNADGTDNYTAQANQIYAKNLKGKLMLAHGMMDDNVPPYNTLLVVEALEKANKDFDLVIFPNSAHGYGQYSPYMMRRRWDYFVTNLLNGQPPKEYQLTSKPDPREGE